MREITEWSPLHLRLTITVANAKYEAFAEMAVYAGELVELGVLGKIEAADLLQEVAIYNQLSFEYGTDRIQKIMADALSEAAA